jgi:hypothetical protein
MSVLVVNSMARSVLVVISRVVRSVLAVSSRVVRPVVVGWVVEVYSVVVVVERLRLLRKN